MSAALSAYIPHRLHHGHIIKIFKASHKTLHPLSKVKIADKAIGFNLLKPLNKKRKMTLLKQ